MQTLKNILNQVVPDSFSQKAPSTIAQTRQKTLLLEKSEVLQKINQLWLQNLPENLQAYSMVGDFNKDVLTVFATQNAIAAKIKLMAPSLLIQLKNQGLEVTAIQVKVQVISPAKPQKIKPNRQLSKQTATQLRRLAQTMQGSDLAESLQRLASRFKSD